MISAKLPLKSRIKVFGLVRKWDPLVQPEFFQGDSPDFTPLNEDEKDILRDQGGLT